MFEKKNNTQPVYVSGTSINKLVVFFVVFFVIFIVFMIKTIVIYVVIY